MASVNNAVLGSAQRTHDMACIREGGKTCFELGICDEKIVGVIGGKRKDAYARMSKWTGDGF